MLHRGERSELNSGTEITQAEIAARKRELEAEFHQYMAKGEVSQKQSHINPSKNSADIGLKSLLGELVCDNKKKASVHKGFAQKYQSLQVVTNPGRVLSLNPVNIRFYFHSGIQQERLQCCKRLRQTDEWLQ